MRTKWMMVLLGAALWGIACNGANTVKVGLVVPLTGDIKTFGQSARNGAMQVFEEVNAAGGIDGRQIQVIVRDDGDDPAVAAEVGGQLVEGEGVVAMIGSVASLCSDALADRCQQERVPVITPTATNPMVTVTADGSRRDYAFRACFIDPFQGTVAAKFARDSLGAARAVVLYDEANDYSRGLAEYFVTAFEDRGGEVVASVAYTGTDEDFAPAVAVAKSGSPDVVFLPDYYSRAGLIARQLREQGVTAQLLGGDGWDSPKMLSIAGEAVHGGFFTSHFSPDDPRPEVQRWSKKYEAKYGRRPDAFATLAHDAALLLVEALRRSGVPTPDGIRDALAGTCDFPAVSGSITFDESGNPIKPAVVLQYVPDGQRYVTTVAP